jgi:hypothetical protein
MLLIFETVSALRSGGTTVPIDLVEQFKALWTAISYTLTCQWHSVLL